MTGCDLCGVGPEDECLMICPSRRLSRNRDGLMVGVALVQVMNECAGVLLVDPLPTNVTAQVAHRVKYAPRSPDPTEGQTVQLFDGQEAGDGNG